MDNPFSRVTAQWLTKMKAAAEQKRKFQEDGDECMRFFRGPYAFMYGSGTRTQNGDIIFSSEGADSGIPRPSAAMTLNKVAEAVQIFGPHMYYRNPIRKVNPRKLPNLPMPAFNQQDPQSVMAMQQFQQLMMQAQSQNNRDEIRSLILQWYQDYTPTATDLKTESRSAIDDCLIRGMGVIWPELWQPPAFPGRIVSNRYDLIDHLIIDGDMESRKDAKWTAKICTKPVWEFESLYGLEPGTIKGTSESQTQKEFVDTEGGLGIIARRQGKSNDLITYYEVYSKMGLGTMLSGSPLNKENSDREIDRFGQYCYLVVCRQLNYPVNLPERLWGDEQAMAQALQWPIPFWADDCWPFAELVLHEDPGHVWPKSHFSFALGELKFLNWAYSFLATRMHKSARDLIVIDKGAAEEMKRVLLNGGDYELIELQKSHNKTIKEVVEVLQFPQVNGDMFKVIEIVEQNFEKRTALTPLIYGETAAVYRSAEEAKVKGAASQTRIDDMVSKTEDWMAQVARMEALVARWMLEPERDIAPVGGPAYAAMWQQYITPADPAELLHQIEYRIEANSARKPNRDKEAADADEAMKQIFPLLVQVAQGGNPGPANALLTTWATSHQWDVSQFLFPPPPPPPPPPPDMPKINVSVAFDTLRPDIQQHIMEMAGVLPPPPPTQDGQQPPINTVPLAIPPAPKPAPMSGGPHVP